MEKDEKNPLIHKTINNYFNAPIGNYNHYDYIEHYHSNDNSELHQKDFPQLPTREEMIQAVKATFSQGLWWSSRSWAVVYRVYQMKGYMNGFTQFAREVNEWGIKTDFECNYDSIQKPIVSGHLSGMPDKWEAQGAQKQAVKLAYALIAELEKQRKCITDATSAE